MANPIHIEVITLERAVFSGQGQEVYFTAERGEIGILAGHLPLMTLVQPGELRIKREGRDERYFVGSGFAEVAHDRVTLLVSAAEGMEQIDLERARRALADAEARLAEKAYVADEELREQAERRARAVARMQIAAKATGAHRTVDG